jgi:hypothetical protein
MTNTGWVLMCSWSSNHGSLAIADVVVLENIRCFGLKVLILEEIHPTLAFAFKDFSL